MKTPVEQNVDIEKARGEARRSAALAFKRQDTNSDGVIDIDEAMQFINEASKG